MTGHDLWGDALGRVAVRANQVLAVLAAAVVVVYALIQLELVVIPLMIALILAATLNPAVRFLRRRGVSDTLATWIPFLATVLALGGVATGIVFSVRSEWDELVRAAAAGLERLREFVVSGPVPIDQQALDDGVRALAAFVTGSRFRTGALLGISAAAEVFAGLVLGAVILFFFLKDGGRI